MYAFRRLQGSSAIPVASLHLPGSGTNDGILLETVSLLEKPVLRPQ